MLLFYCPCPNPETARDLGKQLLTQKLVACINIIPTIESLYFWPDENGQESLCVETETVLIGKSLPHMKEKVMEFLNAHHPYECPALLFFEPDSNELFEKWLEKKVPEKSL